MDALEAELAVLVSETEEEVVNNSGEGVALPSRYFSLQKNPIINIC